MRRYTNQHLTSTQIIEELVPMARDVAADGDGGQQFTLSLSEAELAFYDAVASNQSAITRWAKFADEVASSGGYRHFKIEMGNEPAQGDNRLISGIRSRNGALISYLRCVGGGQHYT